MIPIINQVSLKSDITLNRLIIFNQNIRSKEKAKIFFIEINL